MATYDELRDRFVTRLKRRDLTTTARDNYLQDALARCQTDLRVPAMEKQFSITMDGSTGGAIPIPADYLELRSIYPSGGVETKQGSLSRVLALRNDGPTTNCPHVHVRRGAQWLLGPYPLDGTVMEVDYYAELPALTAGTDTNWLATIRPSMILYAALTEAAPDYVDRRGDSWETYYQRDLAAIQGQADEDELSNAQVSPGLFYPSDDC